MALCLASALSRAALLLALISRVAASCNLPRSLIWSIKPARSTFGMATGGVGSGSGCGWVTG